MALLINVLTTEALCATGWCKSKGRYWLVCVGFLYTDVVTDPSDSGCVYVQRVLRGTQNAKGQLVETVAPEWGHEDGKGPELLI